ncbi:MAG: ABC transporter permease, partial [Frankia sp.]|nr:ABC transporter permease [Frankia sp.]
VIVSGAMTSRMAARRREIALFGAVGVRPAQITAALLVEHLVLGVGAAVLGWLAAALLAPSLEIGAAVTGRPGPSWSLADLLITTATLVALLTVATLVGAVRAGRAPVVDALRDAPPTADRRSRLARLTARVPGPLVLLGLGRLAARPGRSALTGLTMLVAVTGAVVAGGFMVTVTGTLDRPAATGEPWQVMVSRGDVPTAAVEAELARTPGVERWWSEAERRGSRDGQTFRVRALGGEQAPGYEVGAGRLPSRPDEVALGYGLLDQLGLAVGQRATIEVAGKPRELTVVGWYRTAEDDGRILVLPLSGLLAVEPDAVVSQYRVALTPGTSVAATMAGLSAALGPGVELHEQTSDVPGRTVIELVTMLIAGVLVVVALANMLHALLAANREASRDIGVAGALGVTARQLVSQSAVAAAVLGAAAVAVGLPLGLLAFRLQSDAVARDIGLGPGLGVLPPAWFLAALAAGTIALAAASGAAAAAGLARRPLPDLLRWE